MAGIYGLIVLVPQYFMERRIGIDFPPEITHPEFFYGFMGVATAWQLIYFLIAADPVRYRPLMLLSTVAKFSFAGAVAALYARGRVPGLTCLFASIDFVLGVLFVLAFLKSGQEVKR